MIINDNNYVFSKFSESNELNVILTNVLDARLEALYGATIRDPNVTSSIVNIKKKKVRKKSPETILLNHYESIYKKIPDTINKNKPPFNEWFNSFSKHASAGTDITNRFDCCLKMNMLAQLNALKHESSFSKEDYKVLNSLQYFLSRYLYEIDDSTIRLYLEFCKYFEQVLATQGAFFNENQKIEFRTNNCFLALLYEAEPYDKVITKNLQAGVISYLFQNSRFPCPTKLSKFVETKKNMTNFLDLNKNVLDLFKDVFKKHRQIKGSLGAGSIYRQLNRMSNNFEKIQLMLTKLESLDQFFELTSLISLTTNPLELLLNDIGSNQDFVRFFSGNSNIENIRKDISPYHKNVSANDCLQSMLSILEGFSMIESFYYLLLDSCLKQNSIKINSSLIEKYVEGSCNVINKVASNGSSFFDDLYIQELKSFKKEQFTLRSALMLYTTIESLAYFSAHLISNRLNCLKKAEDSPKAHFLKEELNILTEIQNDCLTQISVFHDLINNKHKSDKTTELNTHDVSIEYDEKAFESITISPVLEKMEEIKLEKNEIQVKPEIINAPKTSGKVKKDDKDLNKNVSKPISPLDYAESFESSLEESGLVFHTKRRNLLRALQKEGWTVIPSKGKGSHCKVRGPNGTVSIIPGHKEIAEGTLKSIERSVDLDRRRK